MLANPSPDGVFYDALYETTERNNTTVSICTSWYITKSYKGWCYADMSLTCIVEINDIHRVNIKE